MLFFYAMLSSPLISLYHTYIVYAIYFNSKLEACKTSQVKQNLTIKEQLIEMFEAHLDSQNEKGVKNYSQTLDECDPNSFDWQTMQIEEIVDAYQYAVKENMKLRYELRELKADNLILCATLDHMYSTM